MSHFRFVRDPAILADEQTLLVHVPAGIDEKSQLFAWFAESLKLPTYFGSNWDALHECLRDLSWIQHKRVIIAHRDVPLATNRHDQQIYLDLLEDVVLDWESDPARTVVVSFDPSCEHAVKTAGL